MEKNKTAVEWLVEQFRLASHFPSIKKVINQAKEMEKQQIIDAYLSGDIDAGIYSATNKNAEQYYNETYGKNKKLLDNPNRQTK